MRMVTRKCSIRASRRLQIRNSGSPVFCSLVHGHPAPFPRVASSASTVNVSGAARDALRNEVPDAGLSMLGTRSEVFLLEEGTMRPKTLLLMLVAIGCGLVAAIAVFNYIPDTRSSGTTVEVLIAAAELKQGTLIVDPEK